MNRSNRAYPLEVFLQHLMQEVVVADAQAQILQQTGWVDFHKAIADKEGVDLSEGFGQLEYLGLREVTLTFWVEPVRPGCGARLKAFFSLLFGKPRAPMTQLFRLIPESSADKPGLKFTVTIGRTPDGRFTIQSEPAPDKKEDMHVANLFA
jgi:hypothetical protein